ncbi:hypothetical protein NLU13_5456 [Sarocladium strictum]|uniref:Uncharacterized protein n=1 Tax=Sarocladium strictum TaxID=5046 RepID=A0AA39GGX7_SARSR|nr:hypothetical protein NLU13_5456 [Sarocladium strictum]
MASSRPVVIQSSYPVGSAYSHSSAGSTSPSPSSSPARSSYGTSVRVSYGDHLAQATPSGRNMIMDHGARFTNSDPSPSYSQSAQHPRY